MKLPTLPTKIILLIFGIAWLNYVLITKTVANGLKYAAKNFTVGYSCFKIDFLNIVSYIR